MFVRLVKKNNGRVSVRIVESVRRDGKIKQRTVRCVGHCHGDNRGAVEGFRKAGEAMIVAIRNKAAPVLPGFEELVHAPRKRKKRGAPKGDGPARAPASAAS